MVSSAPESLWQSEVRARIEGWAAPIPPGGELACRTLVVGAGLAGAATSAALAREGEDVLIVDAQGPATGASGRNAGFVLLGNAVEYPRWVERFGRESCRRLLAVARENHRLIRARFGSVCDYEASGSLMLSMPEDDEEVETLRQAHAMLAEDGAEVSFGAPEAVLRGFAEQLTVHEDGQLHPAKLGLALAESVPRRARAHVEDFDWEAGLARCRGGGHIRFERCVLATNAWTRALVPRLENHVTPERGQVFATAPLPARSLLPVAYAGWGYDYFRQRADGRLILGGRRHLYVEAESTELAETTTTMQAALEAYRARHLPFAAEAPITHRWAGIMGFSHDELPFVDALPDSAGRGHLIVAFTGHGLGLTVACGELTARHLLGRPREDDPAVRALFSLGRLPPEG